MKKYSFKQITDMSLERTKLILFRPFELKKWIFIFVIALFAGFAGNANFNMNLDLGSEKERPASAGRKAPARGQTLTPGALKEALTIGREKAGEAYGILKKNKPFVFMFVLLIAAGLAAVIAWWFIQAVFAFVYLDALSRNDASIKIPFHKNKYLGHSYFLWNVGFLSVTLPVSLTFIVFMFRAFFKSGIIADFSPERIRLAASLAMPYFLGFLLFAVACFLIRFLAANFVIPLMYSRKIRVLEGWKIFLGILKKNIGNFLLFFPVKLLLIIAAILAALILLLGTLLALLVLALIVGLVVWIIMMVTPNSAKPVVGIMLTVIGVPAGVAVLFLARLVFLPITVFFRLFSVFFMAAFDDSVNESFSHDSIPVTEDDIYKFDKPIRVFWTAGALFLLTLVISILCILAGGKSLAREGFFDQAVRPPAPVMPAQKIKVKIPEKTESLSEPEQVDGYAAVHMKNGKSIKGEIIKEDNVSITIGIEGGSFTLYKSEIARIERPR
jgi:hypothetical protein